LFQKYQIINSTTNTINISPTSTTFQINYKQTINLKCKTQKRNQYFELNINNKEIQALQNIHAELYKPAPQLLPSLLLPSSDILLIQNTILDPIYQNQLINLHQKILPLNSNNLHFYTDASILNSQTDNISTGIAWILENDTQIKFNASITHAPNSTRAELATLISLFLILPANYQIHIHLDSLSTIQTLTNSIPYNYTSQTKQNNWDIIHILNFLVKHKNINYTTHKVKSHSNNTLHNIVDTLAKQGANKTKLKLNLEHFYLPIFFTWSQIPITHKLHKFCKNLISIQIFNKLLQLKSLRNLPTINILLLTEIINSQNSNLKLYSIRNKILLNNLPTMSNLNIHYPLLYLTSNCSFCNQHENNIHLLQCSLHTYNPHNTLINEISITLSSLNLSETSPHTIVQILNPQNSLSNSTIYNTLLLLIQGTITLDQYKQLQPTLKKLTNNFLILLSNSLLNWFNSTIWHTRNTKQHEWELARGITASIKKKNNIRLPILQSSISTNTNFTFNTDI